MFVAVPNMGNWSLTQGIWSLTQGHQSPTQGTVLLVVSGFLCWILSHLACCDFIFMFPAQLCKSFQCRQCRAVHVCIHLFISSHSICVFVSPVQLCKSNACIGNAENEYTHSFIFCHLVAPVLLYHFIHLYVLIVNA